MQAPVLMSDIGNERSFAMAEDKRIPENMPLTDDQLDEVSGGGTKTLLSYIMVCKRCAADPTHVYAETLKECPICGEKEFTYS